MSEKRKKFTIIDIFIVILLLGIIAFGIWFFTTARVGEGYYIYYVVELRQGRAGTVEAVQQVPLGAEVRDSVRNYALGQLMFMRYEPAVVNLHNSETGEIFESTFPERYDIFLTVRGRGGVTDSQILAQGQPVRIGMDKFLRMRGFAGIGIVVDMRIVDANSGEEVRGWVNPENYLVR
ncbi:MAG: DUF4330 domain-containing protein [Clostridiales bacterium]|jgi:hypothetical protein|nr:DUF4330 domain-containing protein [Clostridiales bacterium]